jgi:HPt (histidine-containing phosphotransfer) domain-containing protein
MTIEQLKELGADTEQGLARCGNNEAFYLRLVGMALEPKTFEELESKINENKLTEAFEAAHALKGVLSNLSLTPIYEPVYEITELLRNRQETDYSELLEKIMEERKRFADL